MVGYAPGSPVISASQDVFRKHLHAVWNKMDCPFEYCRVFCFCNERPGGKGYKHGGKSPAGDMEFPPRDSGRLESGGAFSCSCVGGGCHLPASQQTKSYILNNKSACAPSVFGKGRRLFALIENNCKKLYDNYQKDK